jgi:hypothetical protein
MAPTVRVFDPETKRTVEIPACELAPGMISTQTVDDDGRIVGDTVWRPADPEQASSESRHPPLPELRPLFERFAELFPWVCDTVEKWEDGFRRDQNYAHEILMWAHAADVFEKLTAGRAHSDEKSRNIGRVIAVCMSSDAATVPFVVRPHTVTKKQLQRIIEAYYSGPADTELKEGVQIWKAWRAAHPGMDPIGQLNEELSRILERYIRRRLRGRAT